MKNKQLHVPEAVIYVKYVSVCLFVSLFPSSLLQPLQINAIFLFLHLSVCPLLPGPVWEELAETQISFAEFTTQKGW